MGVGKAAAICAVNLGYPSSNPTYNCFLPRLRSGNQNFYQTAFPMQTDRQAWLRGPHTVLLPPHPGASH